MQSSSQKQTPHTATSTSSIVSMHLSTSSLVGFFKLCDFVSHGFLVDLKRTCFSIFELGAGLFFVGKLDSVGQVFNCTALMTVRADCKCFAPATFASVFVHSSNETSIFLHKARALFFAVVCLVETEWS